MSSPIAYPFLRLSDAAISASSWKIACNDGDFSDAGDFLADWDHATSLRLVRTVRVDFDVASRDLEVDGQSLALVAALRVGTGPGRLPRAVISHFRLDLDETRPTAEFDLFLDGSALSTVLDLQLDLVLASPPGTAAPLSPFREGDRLWQDTARIRLEGEEPRFPIEIADLAALLGDGAAAGAPWYLHWSPRDWSRDFHGSMRLYLNARNKDLIAKVEAEDPDTLRALMADVMGQVCECLARDEEADVLAVSCEDGTLMAQALFWLQLAFPGLPLDHARSVLENRPGVFRAAFQAVAEQQGAAT